MSVTDSEISPPETDDYVNCRECRELTFADELVDGVCGKCYCSECKGEGCLACEPEYVEVDVLIMRDIKTFMEASVKLADMSMRDALKVLAGDAEWIKELISKLPEVG